MSTNICLKEWSAVVEALGNGTQAVAIHGFAPKHNEVILYPTFNFYNSNIDKLNEKFQAPYLDMVKQSGSETTRRGKEELLVDLKYWAKVEDYYGIDDLAVWKALEPYYIWTSQHVVDYAKSKGGGIYLWVLRVYKLPKTEVIGRWNMGGPPDYYRHHEAISTASSKPALSDDDFGGLKAKITKALNKTPVKR